MEILVWTAIGILALYALMRLAAYLVFTRKPRAR
jgi:hypothetical protein